MTKNITLFFILISSLIYSQTNYKVKLLFAYDFPNRHQVGIKLLSQKPLSFTLKSGFQGPFFDWAYNNISNLPLAGSVTNIGTEFNFKNPYHKISLEYEYGYLSGDFQTPHPFNVGKDYTINKFTVNAKNHLVLLGYNFHIRQHSNFSLNIKAGGGYRQSKQHIYYIGSRMYDSKNQLNEPIDQSYNASIFHVRLGLIYCFGHTNLITPLNSNYKNEIFKYFKIQDSILKVKYENYAISPFVLSEYSESKKNFKKYLKSHDYIRNSVKVELKFSKLKTHISLCLYNSEMKYDTYKSIKTNKAGKTKIKRIRKDYYLLRNQKKYKNLYEKYRLN